MSTEHRRRATDRDFWARLDRLGAVAQPKSRAVRAELPKVTLARPTDVLDRIIKSAKHA